MQGRNIKELIKLVVLPIVIIIIFYEILRKYYSYLLERSKSYYTLSLTICQSFAYQAYKYLEVK